MGHLPESVQQFLSFFATFFTSSFLSPALISWPRCPSSSSTPIPNGRCVCRRLGPVLLRLVRLLCSAPSMLFQAQIEHLSIFVSIFCRWHLLLLPASPAVIALLLESKDWNCLRTVANVSHVHGISACGLPDCFSSSQPTSSLASRFVTFSTA